MRTPSWWCRNFLLLTNISIGTIFSFSLHFRIHLLLMLRWLKLMNMILAWWVLSLVMIYGIINCWRPFQRIGLCMLNCACISQVWSIIDFNSLSLREFYALLLLLLLTYQILILIIIVIVLFKRHRRFLLA